MIELTGLDVGESYCFYVQAYIPSRSTEKQLGEQSSTQCSNDDKQSIFDGEQKKSKKKKKIKYNSNTVLSKLTWFTSVSVMVGTPVCQIRITDFHFLDR